MKMRGSKLRYVTNTSSPNSDSLIELELTALGPLRRIEIETQLSMGKEKEVLRYGAIALEQKETTHHGRETEKEREESIGEVIEPMSCNNSKDGHISKNVHHGS